MKKEIKELPSHTQSLNWVSPEKMLKELKEIIETVKQDLINTKKYNNLLPITDGRGKKIMMDMDHIDYLIKILESEEEKWK